MPDSRTVTGNESSGGSGLFCIKVASPLNHSSTLIRNIRWYLGMLNLLTGVVTLGVASIILVLSGRKSGQRNSVISALVPLILVALSLIFLTSRNGKRA